MYLLNISMHNQYASSKVGVGDMFLLYRLLDSTTCNNQTQTPDGFTWKKMKNL